MMPPTSAGRIDSFFAQLLRWRWGVLALYAGLVPVACLLALKIPRDNAIERMVVPGNPDVAATRAFQATFPEQPVVLLVAKSAEPFAAKTLREVAAFESRLGEIPNVTAYSALTVWRRLAGRTGAVPWDDESGAALERFVSGTDFFRRQGLVGPDFWSVVASLDVETPADRDAALAGIDAAIAATLAGGDGRSTTGSSLREIGRVGAPWLDSWLERETVASTARYFPLFGAFVVLLILALYRSARALVAILLSLAVAVLFGVAFGGVAGFAFTIVSSLVPLALMVTATASLVYLHSRFVDWDGNGTLEAHRLWALRNKLLAVSASVFATVVGFAALAVSEIRPIRELGIWTAAGLAIGWLVCFTLYPVLQVLLAAPTRRERSIVAGDVATLAERLPRWAYTQRWRLLVVGTLVGIAGLVALVGLPERWGSLGPMRLQIDALDYVDPDLPAARDTRQFTEKVLGQISVSLLIQTPEGAVVEPRSLAAFARLSEELAAEAEVGSVLGLPEMMRLRRYAQGAGDVLPRGEAAMAGLAGDLEQLLLSEPELRRWVDVETLGETHLKVTARAGSRGGLQALRGAIERAWRRAAAAEPALGGFTYRLVGSGVLQATIAEHLVPTLVESFAITFGIIFLTFLAVFRSGPARLTAMLPSLFAILTMFLFMRLAGIPLNVATILIATTVLGATENDQIHFFYHFQERRSSGSTEQALSHAVRVAGHPIFFATLINAGGFLALALSNLPPMRQFGTVTSAAFVLAMIADFTLLPAALWVLFRARPQG